MFSLASVFSNTAQAAQNAVDRARQTGRDVTTTILAPAQMVGSYGTGAIQSVRGNLSELIGNVSRPKEAPSALDLGGNINFGTDAKSKYYVYGAIAIAIVIGVTGYFFAGKRKRGQRR